MAALVTRLRILWRRLIGRDYFFVGDEEVPTGPDSELGRTLQRITDLYERGLRPDTHQEAFFGRPAVPFDDQAGREPSGTDLHRHRG